MPHSWPLLLKFIHFLPTFAPFGGFWTSVFAVFTMNSLRIRMWCVFCTFTWKSSHSWPSSAPFDCNIVFIHFIYIHTIFDAYRFRCVCVRVCAATVKITTHHTHNNSNNNNNNTIMIIFGGGKPAYPHICLSRQPLKNVDENKKIANNSNRQKTLQAADRQACAVTEPFLPSRVAAPQPNSNHQFLVETHI